MRINLKNESPVGNCVAGNKGFRGIRASSPATTFACHLTPKALLVKAFLLFPPFANPHRTPSEKYAITLKFCSKLLIAGSEK